MVWNQDLRDLRDPCLWPDPNLRCMVWSCWNRWRISCCKLMRRWNLWFVIRGNDVCISSIRWAVDTIATCVKSNVVFLWNHLNLVFFWLNRQRCIFSLMLQDLCFFSPFQSCKVYELQLFLEVTEISMLCAFGSFWEMALATLQAFNDVDLWGFSDGMHMDAGFQGLILLMFFFTLPETNIAPCEDRWLPVGRRNPG